jgi:hypothetical protein
MSLSRLLGELEKWVQIPPVAPHLITIVRQRRLTGLPLPNVLLVRRSIKMEKGHPEGGLSGELQMLSHDETLALTRLKLFLA